MATTTNYGWTTPDDTALVKDGAAAIRTLGSSVDTTTKALNPSTTLGDIEYRSSTANTNTRLGIGTTGQVLAVSGGVPAWTTPAAASSGLTFINKTTFTGVSSVSVPNDTFTTTYDNYKAILTVNSTSANAALSIRMRTSGTDNTAGDYIGAMTGLSFQNVVNNNVSASATAWNLGTPQNGGTPRLQFELGFIRPKLVEISNLNVHGTAGDANGLVVGSMWFNTATAFDAFTFLVASGTMAGTIRVYGYQN